MRMSKAMAMALGMAAMGQAMGDPSLYPITKPRPAIKQNKMSRKKWQHRKALLKLTKESRRNNR